MILRTATLTEVRDGTVSAMLDQALADIFEDCVERPLLKKARAVTLTIKVTPTGDDPLDAGDIDFEVAKKTPAQGITRRMRANGRSRGFSFEADTDNIDHAEGQRTFDD